MFLILLLASGERVDNVDKKAKDAERDSNIAKGIVDGIKVRIG